MKLDLNKPHGVIYGNTAAMYEQNGHQFTGGGELVESVDQQEDDPTGSTAEQWLHELLSGGPMIEGNVFKACEQAGQSWPEIKTVTGVKKYRYNSADMWKLSPN